MENLRWFDASPAVLIVISILVIIVLGLSQTHVYQNPDLLLALNVVFLTGTGIAVSAVSARSFLGHGSLNVLILGSAVLVGALAALVAGYVGTFSLNYSDIVYNIGIAISGGLQFVTAVITLSGKWLKCVRRKLLLVGAYASATILIVILTALTLGNFVPPFLISSGATPIRGVVLEIGVVFFTLSCAFFIWHYIDSRSTVILRYSMALGLFAIGLFSAFFVHQSGEVLSWLARLSIYAGGFYFLAAVLSPPEKTRTRRWTEAFTNNQKQVSLLFSKMLNAFAYCKIVTDSSGKPVDFVFLDVNESYEKMTRMKREDIVGKRMTEIAPGIEKDPADWIGTFGRVALTGEPIRFENCSNLLHRWYSISAYSPGKDYFVALIEDVTDRKRSEREIADLAKFPAENPNVVMRADKEGVILYCNPVGQFLLKEWGTQVGERLPEQKATRVIESLASGERVNFEEIYGDQTFLFVLTPIVDEEYVNVYGIDISARKRLEKELEDYAKNLEKIVEERTKILRDSERLAAIGATAGMVGHDIRNPLQTITGGLYLLKLDLEAVPESAGKAEMRKSLETIRDSVEYINKIVSDLQDFAKPLHPSVQKTNLEDLCRDFLQKSQIPKTIKTTCRIEKDAKEITVDSSFLKRIIDNLVANAIQAMPEGGKLELRGYREAGDTVIVIRDTGNGIPESVKPKLFTPLMTTKAKGQGFGLAIVKRMTEAMNGTVTFESEVGKGTEFMIRFPSPGEDNE